MTTRMVPDAVAQPLRRLLGGAQLAPTVAEEHLHYDRNARAWRTHDELRTARHHVWAEPETELAGCA